MIVKEDTNFRFKRQLSAKQLSCGNTRARARERKAANVEVFRAGLPRSRQARSQWVEMPRIKPERGFRRIYSRARARLGLRVGLPMKMEIVLGVRMR